ncbi:MAG: G5 domain-containing protein [Chloroflexi bacterium]|nr:G5 domain-containing protein [Chloroflexota bacterium]
METLRWLALSLTVFLVSCQPNITSDITIIDGGQIHHVTSAESVPLILFTQNGISPQPNDRVLLNGSVIEIDKPLPEADFIQLQLRRAVTLTIVTAQGEQSFQSSAFTVGQALAEAGYSISAGDLLDPPAETRITQPLTISYTQARDFTISAEEFTLKVRSAAGTVGRILSEAGIPLIGADTSVPLENDAPPADGQIHVTRVYETTSVELKPIPFTTKKIESVDIPLGQEDLIQPGIDGLAMIRTRIRYENGKETNRVTESETVMREPQERIVASGEQIVFTPVGGDIPYDYWIAVEMYATVYSPCASGTGGCSYGTASGARAGQGIVAVDYSIYSYLAGMRVYIPGYGVATIGDTGGGPIIESAIGVPRTKWIDLGFNEGEMRNMTGWVTVYFLAPAPAEVPYFLK